MRLLSFAARRSASAGAAQLDDRTIVSARDAALLLPFQASARSRAAALLVVLECSHGMRVIA
jgi:hypothetical protein